MSAGLKKDIKHAVTLVIIATLLGLIVNSIRTPVLESMQRSGSVQPAFVLKYKGVNLVDDWSHKGWPMLVPGDGKTSIPDGTNKPPVNGGDVSKPQPTVGYIGLTQVEDLLNSGTAIFFDARTIDDYNTGHIAGAKPWPSEEFQKYFEIYKAGTPLDARIVVYCSGGDCDLSRELASDLIANGFLKIDQYQGGYDEWSALGKPVKTGGGDGT